MSTPDDAWLNVLKKIREGLGNYDPVPVVAELFRFLDEGLVLVDTEGRMAFMDRLSENSFGLPPGGAKGLMFQDFFRDLGLLEVAKTGIPQIGRVQEIRGAKRLVTRLPIIKDRQLIGALGTIVFHDLEGIENSPPRIGSHRLRMFSVKNNFPAQNAAQYTFADILGKSPSLTETKERAMRAALTDCNLLITGESGTGKELLAHSIHQFSKRSGGPFVRVNCPSIPFDLVESELFGYERGAFTGARETGQRGKFELASGGTIFLDEISAMPLTIQAKLLRVIQEKELEPLGSSGTRRIDFRLVAATNVDLLQLVQEGKFRADLYYRVTSVPVSLSPLRERHEDIPLLAQSLLPGINQKLCGAVRSISAEAIRLMSIYRWPGNVRELINVLEQSVLNAHPKQEIGAEHLPAFLKTGKANDVMGEKAIRGIVADAERKAINYALEKTGGNKKKAAELLGVSRVGLYEKLRRLRMT